MSSIVMSTLNNETQEIQNPFISKTTITENPNTRYGLINKPNILIDNRPKNIIPEAQKDLRNNKKFKIKK